MVSIHPMRLQVEVAMPVLVLAEMAAEMAVVMAVMVAVVMVAVVSISPGQTLNRS